MTVLSVLRSRQLVNNQLQLRNFRLLPKSLARGGDKFSLCQTYFRKDGLRNIFHNCRNDRNIRHNLAPGDIVIIVDDSAPRHSWMIAILDKKKGVVRHVKIKTKPSTRGRDTFDIFAGFTRQYTDYRHYWFRVMVKVTLFLRLCAQ